MEESPPRQFKVSTTPLERRRRRRQKAARFKGEKTGGLVEEKGVDEVDVSQTDRVGQFWFVDSHVASDGKIWGLSGQEKTLLRQIEPFFRDQEHLRKYVVPANNEDPSVPALRLIVFALTNTFKTMPTKRICKDGKIVDAHQVYLKEQTAWRRSLFDAFRRGQRVWFRLDGCTHYTTVGQLNFWRVIIQNEIIDQIVAREREVQDHAREQQRLDRKRKREATNGR